MATNDDPAAIVVVICDEPLEQKDEGEAEDVTDKVITPLWGFPHYFLMIIGPKKRATYFEKVNHYSNSWSS